MNKKDLSILVLLILMIPLWTIIDSKVLKPMFPEPPAPVPTATPVLNEVSTVSGEPVLPVDANSSNTVTAVVDAVSGAAAKLPDATEVPVVIANDKMTVRLTNLGAGIARVVLHEFDETLQDKLDGTGVKKELDFSLAPALRYDVAGIDRNSGFAVVSSNETSVVFERALTGNVVLQRTLTLGDNYMIAVNDRWINQSAATVRLPDQPIWLGDMTTLEGVSQKFGPYLGVDANHNGEDQRLHHYVKDIAKMAKNATKAGGSDFSTDVPAGFNWFTAKNKFFVQVLSLPDGELPGAQGLIISGKASGNSKAPVESIRSGATLGGLDLLPGQSVERKMSYYVGPMHMSELRTLGLGQEEAMDFRLWAIFNPIGKGLMWGLTTIRGVIPNWGLSIILLTILVRLLFWPLTHKGTVSMRKMQELAPQMKEIREKHKSNPQVMNQKMAEFYKQNQVNPMAGCMPMIVQIPVFIALYGMLRVAVELRFAEFLWIRDLSEAENLFGMGINLLPLIMGGTMFLQQRMMPQTGDPQQRMIMQIMPVFITFVCYAMPAGLLLYWCTSNVLSIVQTHFTHKKLGPAPAMPSLMDKKPAGKKGK